MLSTQQSKMSMYGTIRETIGTIGRKATIFFDVFNNSQAMINSRTLGLNEL